MRMYQGFFVIALLGLSGCGRVVDWGKEVVPQARSFKQDLATGRSYVRSVTAYDQLTTAARFDALWLSDEVRRAYVRLFVDRRGKSEEQYATILRRQLEENNFVIAFYVLCPFEITLGDTESEWMVFLRVDNATFTPIEVKVVDLASEYKALFDKQLNRFKQVYLVKFDARDIDDSALLKESSSQLSLVFRSLRKELALSWDLKKIPQDSSLKTSATIAKAPVMIPQLSSLTSSATTTIQAQG